jgi:hypothetical protein
LREVAPADFPPLIGRDPVYDENLFWDLPRAQAGTTKPKEISFADAWGCHHAGGYFFIAQCSCARRSTKDHCLPHACKTQQMRFHFRRIHFFTRDIDHI